MSENYNRIVKMFKRLDKTPEECDKKKKKLTKPPANWTCFAIKKYIKENPDLIGNSLFENPFLYDFSDAVQYAAEIKQAKWEAFDNKYVLPITKEPWHWGFDSLKTYFEKAYNENSRNENFDKVIDKRIVKINRVVDKCAKKRKWFTVIFEEGKIRKLLLEMDKVSSYLSATKDRQRLDSVKDVLIKMWSLVNKKIENFNLTKEQYAEAEAARRSNYTQNRLVKQYHELLSLSHRFCQDCDYVFSEYDSRVSENICKYLEASVRFLDSELSCSTYTSINTRQLAKHIALTEQELPQNVIHTFEKEPKLWIDYVQLCYDLKHKISNELTERIAVFVAELIKATDQETTGWHTYRNMLYRAEIFFKYAAKYNTRYEVIEKIILQKECVQAAKEYTDAFKEQPESQQ